MPIYEYACAECGHHFDKRQKFSDEPVSVCPKCGSQVHRVLHPAGIIFKGSGWYITDSRKSNAGSLSGGASGTHPANHTHSEEKPAAEAPAEKAATPVAQTTSDG